MEPEKDRVKAKVPSRKLMVAPFTRLGLAFLREIRKIAQRKLEEEKRSEN